MSIHEVILTVMLAGFGVNLMLLYIVWTSLTTRCDKLESYLKDIDQRVCRMEGAISSGGACGLKQEYKKAE